MKTIPPAHAEQQLTHVAEPAEPIPQYLWEQAIALTTVSSISRVATRLRVSGGELKKRCAAHHAARSAPASTALGFVEVTATSSWASPASGTEIELHRADGARLRIRTHEPQLPLAALVRTFLETP